MTGAAWFLPATRHRHRAGAVRAQSPADARRRRAMAELDAGAALARRELKGREPESLTWDDAGGDRRQAALYRRRSRRARPSRQPAGPGAVTRGPRATMYAGPALDDPAVCRASRRPRSRNAFYRQALAAGQQGVSVAFDLATHRGYDSDHPRVVGDVGKAGRRDRLGRGHEDPVRRHPARQGRRSR